MATVLAYITAKDLGEAERLGKNLVESKFAACVNILPGMHSIYRWQGKVEDANEVLVIAKTDDSLGEALIAEVKRLHSYECPCVLLLPVSGGNVDYLRWLGEGLKHS
jgi:periplasmic divalent cation tolerance protein